MSTPAMIVMTTCENRERARSIADALVGERLAACVSAVPGVSSTYRWLDKIEHDDEVLLLIKTTEEHVEAVEQALKTLSTYELPEVLAVRIQAGSPEYLAWLGGSVGGLRSKA